MAPLCFATIGAERHRARVAALAGEAIDPAPHRPTAGWDSLTPTELEVARLVGEGLTNAEIADRQGSSRRTVETHVSRLYRKLEAPNRVVLAQLASSRNTPDT